MNIPHTYPHVHTQLQCTNGYTFSLRDVHKWRDTFEYVLACVRTVLLHTPLPLPDTSARPLSPLG